MKKVIKWLGIVFVLLVVALAAAPYLFKDRIVTAVKSGLNESIEAKADFSDVSVSFFRSFPHLQVTLYDLVIDGIKDFEGVPLFHARSASATIGFWSLFGTEKPIEILDVASDYPLINIVVLPDGRANYDIAKDEGATEGDSGSGIKIQIDYYELKNGELSYVDQSIPMSMRLGDFNHSGSGNFASMQFDLDTKTDVEWLTVNYDGVAYMDSVKAALDAVIQMDLNASRYTLSDNKLLLNDLELGGSGFVQLNNEDIELDLSIVAPKSDFRQLMSIMPGAYTSDFAEAKIAGSFDLTSNIKGRYVEDSYPSIMLKTEIDNGSIQYPDLPLAIAGINLDLAIDKPQGGLDLLEVVLSKMQMQVGPQPLKGHLSIRTPMSDPDVEGGITGTLDLVNLSKAYPMEGIEELQGTIFADVQFKARMSEIDKKEYEKLAIKGNATVSNLAYKMSGMPPISILDSKVEFSPQSVTLKETRIQAGRSDVSLEGRLENVLALISPNQTARGNIRVRSEMLDMDEWYGAEESDSGSQLPATGSPAAESVMIPSFDIDVDAQVKEARFAGNEIKDVNFSGRLQPEEIDIRKMSAVMQGSDVDLRGTVRNYSSYLAGEDKITGAIVLQSRKLDLNPFMSSAPNEEVTDSADLTPFIIPDNVDIEIDARVGELVYTDMVFTNLKGKVIVREQSALLQDCAANAFGGTVDLAGGYRTLDGSQPTFDLKYDMTNVQFSQIAAKVSYVNKLVPIIKYFEGRFSTSFITNGALQDNFMPDLTTFNLDGLMETSEAVLRSFGPLEELASRLQMNFLKSPKIKNTKNWLEVKNGIVEVKEFDYEVEDVAMKISGRQSLSQELNYLIKMKVPRKYLDANELTSAVGSKLSWLSSEANKLGFKLSTGDYVNINVVMTGTLTKPVFDLKLVGMDGEKPLVDQVKEEVKAGVQNAVDSAKAVAEAKKDSLLKKGEEKVDAVIDTISKEAQKAVDTLAAKATEEVKKKVDEELGKKAEEVFGDKIGEVGGESVKEGVDNVVDKLKGWKPFGKKKDAPEEPVNEPGKKSE